MDDQNMSMRRGLLGRRFAVPALALVTLGILAASPGVLAAPARLFQRFGFAPHAPDLSLIAAAPLAVQLHIAGALVALAIGTALLIGVKGNGVHRVLGWTWVVAMALTAVSSLFIRSVNSGDFSFIHLLSGWTLIALPMGVFAIKRRKVSEHRRTMTGMFVGGLLVAGLLAFFPGRLLWHVFLG